MPSRTSASSGYWDSLALWGNNLPIANDTVTIANGHTVTVRESNYSLGTIGGLVWGDSWVKHPDVPYSISRKVFAVSLKYRVGLANSRGVAVFSASRDRLSISGVRDNLASSRARNTIVSSGGRSNFRLSGPRLNIVNASARQNIISSPAR